MIRKFYGIGDDWSGPACSWAFDWCAPFVMPMRGSMSPDRMYALVDDSWAYVRPKYHAAMRRRLAGPFSSSPQYERVRIGLRGDGTRTPHAKRRTMARKAWR